MTYNKKGDLQPLDNSPHHFAEESLRCAGALKNRLLTSSRDVGWTSCLLDHVEGLTACNAHETHITPDLTLVVATRGEHDLDVFSGGRWHRAIYQTGAMGLTPGGQSTRLRWSNRKRGQPFRTAHLYIPAALLIEAGEHLRRPGQSLSVDRLSSLITIDHAAFGVVEALLEGQRDGTPDFYAETAVRWLALELLSRFRQHAGPNYEDRSPGILTDKRLARAVEYLSEHLQHPLSVADLAREAGISAFHFSRLFRHQTGLSPYGYLTRERLSRSRRLLETTDLPVSMIGAECGFPTASSFSSAFSRFFGASPTKISRGSRGR